ncbi:MAG TPA: CRISPR-associated helicase Cas3' [Kouleothrix sp.]|uniref:CRISPR-associated helicase Cas3' n=1 Tax=Kouleothrix sp. TaxID=2779161 RepID=UPI002C47EA32|nr:CRISPR-associated helicase Cas3' [Kouleothrix sp.]
MQPAAWPDWLDSTWGKSAGKGEQRGESLAQHTWLVISRLADLQRLRPDLPQLVGVPKLWHYLFWTCMLHDFGKAAQGFQDMLRGKGRWGQRHEVLSLIFVDWLAGSTTDDEQRWLVAGIASHHRDAKTIDELYHDLADPDPLVGMVAELAPEIVDGLWRWLDECAAAWITALDLEQAGVTLLALHERTNAVWQVGQQGAAQARARLQQYRRFVTRLSQPTARSLVAFLTLVRGLTTSADHMASAHVMEMPAPVQEAWMSLAARILKPGQEPYTHQEKSASAYGTSTILVAPTGSGKTEAALYWALGDGTKPAARIFYALPYQASMNAMFDRLKDEAKGFGERAVGVQHGRALQAMYARLMNQESTPKQAAGAASWEKNINTLNARPIKVFSPYQMLKAMFQLRGFEAMLTDYAQAAFIFDEIHAYEPERLALILALVKYLREDYGARFFMMSATFPRLIRSKLQDALGIYKPIEADETVFQQFRRHRLHLLDGELIDPLSIQRIADEVRAGKQVLVCANTVARAQQVQAALQQAGLPDNQLLLIHSRYIFRDRNEREQRIRDLCGVDAPLEQRTPLALIATQVVEVSLNIDLATIYSEPAPLEALLQRFGRVNRQCKRGICPVYVFRLPNDGQGVYGRHKNADKRGHIVRVTLGELEAHDCDEVDEAAINVWLDRIYDDAELSEQWETTYQQIAADAIRLLTGLRPFNSDDQKEDQFEAMFDNVEIVPARFEQQYVTLLMNDEFIEASNYLVGISKQKFAMLRDKGLVRRAEAEGKRGAWVAKLEYDDGIGLMFDSTSHDRDWD